MISYGSIVATNTTNVTEPVTVAQVKAWANIDHADDDALLQTMITGARQDIEGYTNLALVPKTVTVLFDTTRDLEFVRLPYGVPETVAVLAIGEDDEETAQAVGEHYHYRTGHLRPIAAGFYKVTYGVGLTAPEALKEAVKMLVTYRYHNRGDNVGIEGLPKDVQSKIHQYRIEWL